MVLFIRVTAQGRGVDVCDAGHRLDPLFAFGV
jgi:hypothetical protein